MKSEAGKISISFSESADGPGKISELIKHCFAFRKFWIPT
jgi:hypothetical protein